jgi:hypothetical protein
LVSSSSSQPFTGWFGLASPSSEPTIYYLRVHQLVLGAQSPT